MKTLFSIENFSNGVVSDATSNLNNGGLAFVNVDIHNKESHLQVSQKLTQETDVFTDLVKWFVRDDNDATYKYWALGDTGNLYKSASIGGTWSLSSNVGGHGNGMTIYNGSKYYCTDTGLSGGSSHTIDSDNLWHPMVVYLGALFGGAGRYVFKLESDGTFTVVAAPVAKGNFFMFF